MKNARWSFRSGRSVRLAVALVLAAFLPLFYPFQTTIVPEWTLKVVDEEGVAVSNINVTEHWQHFLLEKSSQEDVRRVGDNGMVSFPVRNIRASLLRRGIATIDRIKNDGWRARRSPAASVVVWGNKDYATTVAVYNPNDLPQSHIIVPSVR